MVLNLLENKENIDQFLSQTSRQLSAFSFSSIFAWQPYYQFDGEIIHGNLCLFAKDDLGTFLYLPPLGSAIKEETIQDVFQIMTDRNGRGNISRIENVHSGQLHFFPEDKYQCYKKYYEYCYYRQDIVSLRGNSYKSKRALYNSFVKNNHSHYAPYERHMKDECAALYQRWMQQKKQKPLNDMALSMLEENRRIHEHLLEFSHDINLIGRVVIKDNTIVAYTFGYHLNSTIFCILLEITDLDIKGLPVFIFREFCADKILGESCFINVMDDFEMKNLSWTKKSFHPTIQFPCYVVTQRTENGKC